MFYNPRLTQQLSLLFQRVQSDSKLEQELLQQPKQLLLAQGIDIPAGINVETLTKSNTFYTFPQPGNKYDATFYDKSFISKMAAIRESIDSNASQAEKFNTDPTPFFKAQGFIFPTNCKVRLVPYKANTLYLFYYPELLAASAQSSSSATELNDAELDEVAGGGLLRRNSNGTYSNSLGSSLTSSQLKNRQAAAATAKQSGGVASNKSNFKSLF